MVTAALVDSMVEDGRKLIETLDQSDIVVKAALWLYHSESERWRLVVATPLAKEEGTRGAYLHIYPFIKKLMDETGLTPLVLTVVAPDDSLVRQLRKAVRVGPGPTGVRFSGSVSDGGYVEDAYIYRLP